MGEQNSVKLHGMWASPYVLRALLGLKIKGIKFEYIEEDLPNKSEQLLQYNPVHKKVPVLVHDGQPIAESQVILEYIDETWTDPPHLLPKDPYQRAKVRFWAAYFQLVMDIMPQILRTEGEALQTALKQVLEKLDVAEQGLKDILPSGATSLEDGNPGYLDIVFYSLFGIHEVAEQVFGIKVFSPERYPLLSSWNKAISEAPAVKEATPPVPKLVEAFQFVRQKNLASQA